MANIFDIVGEFTGKPAQQIKGNAKEVQLDILTRSISLLTLTNTKILRNIYIPYADGKTSEVDMLLLANGNIYVFEVKNYQCAVVGKQDEKCWKAIYTPQKTYEFYNPIKQNDGHIASLSSYLKIPKSDFISVVVFSEKADIKKVEYTPTSNLRVLSMNAVGAYLVKQKFSKKMFSKDELKDVYSALKPLTKVSDDVKEQHIKDVQSKQ